MKKQYIKMNNSDEHLSLGNLFRIIKESSKNKYSALQSELFCILFDLESINDTTVNNYCVGCRGIGSDYKQIFLNKNKKYFKNYEEFADNIIGILSVIDGVVYNNISAKVDFIDSSESAHNLAWKLYNLAKNDRGVINEFTNKLFLLLNDNKVYECLVEELVYIVLLKKQPMYEDELKKEVFENVLNDTSISSVDLQEYLSLKLREGINFDYSMKKLASNGNAYANFELGSDEYYGYFAGYPRYDKAFVYLDKAAALNHASANYMIGNMFISGFLGSKSKEELEKGYEYLQKSYDLGNVAASNLIGNMYYNGIHPLKKDLKKAISYYKRAADSDYVFGCNNLGKIAELDGNLKEAFSYYLKSADLGESWACNKVGEYYRTGKIEKNMELAFKYYNRALESNCRTLCYYAYYNLARYFYSEGYGDVVLGKDINKMIEYYDIAANNDIIEAAIELFMYYIKKYYSSRDVNDLNNVYKYKLLIESNKKYNNKIKNKIENNINILENKKEISVDWLKDI